MFTIHALRNGPRLVVRYGLSVLVCGTAIGLQAALQPVLREGFPLGMLPVGIVVGLAGVLLVVGGLFARIDKS